MGIATALRQEGTLTTLRHYASTRRLHTLIVAIALLLAGSSAARAAPAQGCNGVNSGVWNQTLGPNSSGNTITHFNTGDEIHFSVTGSSAFQLNATAGPTVLTFITPGSGSYTVAAPYTSFNTRNLGIINSITITATCTPAPSPTPTPSGADASQTVTKGFLVSRINGILLNNPGGTSLLNRSHVSVPVNVASAANGATNVASNATAFGSAMGLGAGLGNAMGLGTNSLGDDAIDASGGRSIQFSHSLSHLRRQAAQAQMSKERMALGAGDGAALPLAYETTSPWDIWVEGRYSAFDDDNGNLDRDGHVGVLYVGGDYRVAGNMIVGALIQFDWSKDDSDVLASTVDGNGWMIGPYLSARIHENIYFDLRAAWGRSSNDLTLGTTTGGFDTSRWLVKGTLAGNWLYDAWRFTPSAELAYVEESQDAFTNSAGTFIAGQDVSLGRLQFGPEIGYRFAHSADTFIEPFAAIKGVWDFDNPNVAIVDGFVVGPGDFWGRLEGGLNVITTSGWYLRGLASWDGVGSDDYSGYTLQGTLNVPLN